MLSQEHICVIRLYVCKIVHLKIFIDAWVMCLLLYRALFARIVAPDIALKTNSFCIKQFEEELQRVLGFTIILIYSFFLFSV